MHSTSSIERVLFGALLTGLAACSGGSATDGAQGAGDASSDAPTPVPGSDSGPTPDASEAPDAHVSHDGGSGDSAPPPPPDSGTPDSSSPGVACSGASPGFAMKVEPIFQTSCGGENCHNGTAGPTWPYATLVNVPVDTSREPCATGKVRVSPGSLADSYLINKLTGVDMCPGTSVMPKGGALPASDVQTIADWICSGAKNN